jgi:hypothetical protein
MTDSSSARKPKLVEPAKWAAIDFLGDRREINGPRLRAILRESPTDPEGTLAALSPGEREAVLRLAYYAIERLAALDRFGDRNW